MCVSSIPRARCSNPGARSPLPKNMTQMPTTEATHARIAGGTMRLLSGYREGQGATVTTKRKKALSPRDVVAKTAPASAQAIRAYPARPTTGGSQQAGSKANVPVIAHDDVVHARDEIKTHRQPRNRHRNADRAFSPESARRCDQANRESSAFTAKRGLAWLWSAARRGGRTGSNPREAQRRRQLLVRGVEGTLSGIVVVEA